MASEIRANTLKNRVGLGTVSFTNTGPVVSGIVTIANSTSEGVRLEDNAGVGNSLKITTPTGYVSIGSGNSTFVHLQTDRGVFYFQKRIFVDEGIIGSYDENLVLQSPSNTTRITINKDTGLVSIVNDLDVDGHTNLDNVSIAGVTTTTDDINIDADNKKLLIGDSQDLELFHDGGTLSYIRNNTGKLVLRSDTFQFGTQDGAHRYIDIPTDEQGVSLFYDNVQRLATTSSGVSVTGNISATGNLTPSGTLYLTDAIEHTDDSNTKIRFPADDTFTVETNNTERFRIGSNGYIGVGNFSSKSRTDPLNVDSGIGTCNIGGNYIHLKRYSGGGTNYITAPENNANLHISADDYIVFGVDHSSSMYSMGIEALRIGSNGTVLFGTTTTANSIRAVFQGYPDGGENFQARIRFQSNQATNLTSGSHIANLLFTNASGSEGARIDVKADSNWGTGSYPSRIEFSTTPSGANTPVNRLNIDAAGRVTLGAGTQGQYASAFNSGANQLLITSNGSTGLTIDSTSSHSSSIHFADGPTGGESYRGIIEYQHSVDDMKFGVEAQHVARLRKGSYSDVGGGMIIGNSVDVSGSAHSDSRTLILGATTHGETGMTLLNSTSGSGKIRFSDGTSPYNQGTIAYYHPTRTVAQIPNYAESFSISPAQIDNQFVLNGNEGIRVCSDMDRQKMVDGFWHKDLTTSFQTVFSIQSGYDNSSIHRAYFYEIIVYGGDWGSHSANRVYFKGFINGYDGYQGHTVIEHSGTYGSNTGGQGHYGSSQCTIQVTFTGNGNSHIQMKLSTGSYRAEGYARFVGFIRDYDGFHIR